MFILNVHINFYLNVPINIHINENINIHRNANVNLDINVYMDIHVVHIYSVTTATQPQVNSKVGFDMKMTLHHPPPPGTQRWQYFSCS